jgi:hypothetical protein
MTKNHVVESVIGLIALSLLLAGCQRGAPVDGATPPQQAPEGAAAVWQIADATALNADSDAFDVGVTRMQCSGGVTGEALDPVIDYAETTIVVRIDVVPLDGDLYSCPGNNSVPVSVKLDEPIGDRVLVDGGCAHPDMSANVYCESAIRWDVSAEVR